VSIPAGAGIAMALAAAANQITVIVTESLLFGPLRDAVRKRSHYLGELVSCHLCFGTWVGFALALVFRPGWIGRNGRGPARALAVIADGFAIAYFGRLLNELTAKVQREVRVLDETAERLEDTNDRSLARDDGEPLARHP
jgi:hypothetical protein